ncbi:terminase large subunit [Acinetobacter phage Presley]|uniref:Terminase large subunit n=1 Tax=Acinetobacter phage Presley TaxID=1406780 RepID=U5PZT1_9CAUD|nr:terminase large subunit [Acinetobacter phage Presley]AGY48157.1 terminase large subunit [Acinetobacter phage Presley]
MVDLSVQKKKAPTVEDYLNNIDYSDLEGYVPTDFALQFVNFIKLVNGGQGEENLTPLVHFRVLDSFTTDKQNVANMMHRGIGKTTLMEYLFLYLATYEVLPGFGVVNLAIYVSDSVDNGVANMRKNLEYRWENSEFLQQVLPPECCHFTNNRWELGNKNGHKLIIKGYGAKTGVRGTKELGKRPQLAILDDLVSDEDARSPTVISSIKDTVHKAIKYAMHPTKSKTFWCGTPFNAGDPLYEVVESGEWEVNVYPICEKFPCSREEFRGSWPDRFTYDYVKRTYDMAIGEGTIAGFNQELMLRIMSDDDRLIQESDIRWYSLRTLMANKDSFNFYITTDFATSAKQSADFNFISVWAVNHLGDWFWCDGICKRQTMDHTMNDLFRLVQKWRPLEVGVEVTGQQAGFIPWITDQMMNRNIWFSLGSHGNSSQPGIRPTTDKLQRFNVTVPMFKKGSVYFPNELYEDPEKRDPALVELLEELRLVAASGFKSKHDDGLDTISQLPLLRLIKPSEVSVGHLGSTSMWDIEEEQVNMNPLKSYIV